MWLPCSIFGRKNMTISHIPLHVHDYYSALDGFSSPEEYMSRAKDLGIKHIAQTNHGTLIGHRHFQRAAKEAGLNPILGVEAYFSTTDRFDRRAKNKRQDSTNIYNHIVVLAQNENGLQNLQRASEIAWNEGFYFKPRMDMEVLAEYNQDLIVLSGCMRGPIADTFLAGDEDEAVKWALRFKDLFGDRFYIEIQDHNPYDLNLFLLSVADKHGIKPVITDDCHYSHPEQKWLEESFLILSSNRNKIKDPDMTKMQKMDMLERFRYMYPEEINGKRNGISYDKLELFLAETALRHNNLKKLGIDRTDIFENTHEIAERIGEYPYYSGLTTIPLDPNANEELWNLCIKGLHKRGLENSPEHLERLKYEYQIIVDKGFAPYFLIVADALNWAKSQEIMVGPGRGSSAGSLVCYLIYVTEIDPLPHGLIFERFLDPSRPDWPDIDTDIEAERRHEVKDYLEKKYGNVASISTITYYKDKAAIKDAARVMGVPFAESNRAVKDFPTDNNTINEFAKSPLTVEFRKKYPEVLPLARQLRGRVKNVGMHAAGLIISEEPISKYASVESRPGGKDREKIPVVGLDMTEADSVGFIKIDLLGLSNLTVIKDCLKMIQDRHGKIIDPWHLPKEDKKTFDLLKKGHTAGVFQFEESASTALLHRMQVQDFNDLVIATSLVRTGAWKAIGEDYIATRMGQLPKKPIHKITEEFTEETLYFVVYQEQLMKLCTDLAGMSVAQANKVRKITAKKQDPKLLAEYREMFIEGSTKHISQAKADKLWESFEIAAEYMFNKSHAVAYCTVAYATAYLKAHYPMEFMCAILKNENTKEKKTAYLIDCKQMGIKLKLPHINKSKLYFSIDEEDDCIRFGLQDIKGFAEKSARKVIEYGPYPSYEAFKEKVLEKNSGLTTRHLSALNKIGAATFRDNPVIENYRDNLYEYLDIPAFNTNMLTTNMKNNLRDLKDFDEYETFVCFANVSVFYKKDSWARLALVDSTGIARVFIDPNEPIEKNKMYLFLIGNNSVIKYVAIDELEDKSEDLLVDYLRRPAYNEIEPGQYKVIAAKVKVTRAGKKMAYIVFSDANKELVTLPVWPKMFEEAKSLCRLGSIRAVDIGRMPDGTKFVKGIV